MANVANVACTTSLIWHAPHPLIWYVCALPNLAGVREHPELSVGSQTEGIDVRSVGNSLVLQARHVTPTRPPRDPHVTPTPCPH
eukprot:3119913-Prymnesium_polylepis.1